MATFCVRQIKAISILVGDRLLAAMPSEVEVTNSRQPGYRNETGGSSLRHA